MSHMIKLEELSAGNIVRLVSHPMKPLVTVVNTSYGHWAPFVNITNKNLDIFDEHHHLDDIDTVELTEELCEKMGLTTDGDHTLQGSGRYRKLFGDTEIEIRPRDHYLRLRYHDDAWYTHLETDQCRYLHQLQNFLSNCNTLTTLCYLAKFE